MRGKTTKEIAKMLRLSHRTVEKHIETLKIKFNCIYKSEVIEKAFELGYSNILPKTLFQTQTSIIVE
jgi:DNA-binding CsgD family transcriptional regulator